MTSENPSNEKQTDTPLSGESLQDSADFIGSLDAKEATAPMSTMAVAAIMEEVVRRIKINRTLQAKGRKFQMAMRLGARLMARTVSDMIEQWDEDEELEEPANGNPELLEEEMLKDVEVSVCPHGKPPAECNDCMIASDQAFDAAREQGRVR